MTPSPSGRAGSSRPPDLFDVAVADELKVRAPLAARLRPTRLDEVVGQRHLLGPGAPLRALVEDDRLSSAVFFGPPGTGKTLLAIAAAVGTWMYYHYRYRVSSDDAEVDGHISAVAANSRLPISSA